MGIDKLNQPSETVNFRNLMYLRKPQKLFTRFICKSQ